MSDQVNDSRRKESRLAELLSSGDYDYTQPRSGEVREAVILSISDRDMLVDLGGKRDGVVPPRDLQLADEEYVSSLQVGDRIPVVVMRRRIYDTELRVSLNKGLQHKDWLRAEELLESGEIIEATVTEENRGGVLVQVGNVRGFVPNSHLGALPSGHREGRLQEAKSELVGKTLSLVVIEVNQRRNRLVLSKRAVDRRRRGDLLKELEPGERRMGRVSNIVDFGAFVDLGGIDGLVHISELDWAHVSHPSEVLKVGDELEVYVLSVDVERQRISLSRKRLLADPWETVTDGMQPGDLVTGTVTNVVEFGVFVDVGQGVEGLVHESKLPLGSVAAHPEIVPEAGVVVEVLAINPSKQQISLRMVSPAESDNSADAPEDAPLDLEQLTA